MPVMTPFRWVRVDDRLLHGQVALGWRSALDPRGFLIVDDDVAADPMSATLFEAALPEGTRLFVLEVRGFLKTGAPEGCDPARTILLVRDLPQLRRLCDGGFHPTEVNVGGIHHHPGAREVLDYLFLNEEDIAAAESILGRGISIFAQDLPSSSRRDWRELLSHGGDDR